MTPPTITSTSTGDTTTTTVEVTQRYTVEIYPQGGETPTWTFQHDTEGSALARVTAWLVKYPTAPMREERVVDTNRPIAVCWKLFLPKGQLV